MVGNGWLVLLEVDIVKALLHPVLVVGDLQVLFIADLSTDFLTQLLVDFIVDNGLADFALGQ